MLPRHLASAGLARRLTTGLRTPPLSAWAPVSRLLTTAARGQLTLRLADATQPLTRYRSKATNPCAAYTTWKPSDPTTSDGLYQTPLYEFHRAHGGKMVPFAGYAMPVQYTDRGLLASHRHTREAASLFDVSHMLQVVLTGADRVRFLESLTVGDLQALQPGQATLSVLTNEGGGIIDDTVITNQPAWLEHPALRKAMAVDQGQDQPAAATHDGAIYMVLNAACAAKDLGYIRTALSRAINEQGYQVGLHVLSNVALLALQGPQAAEVLTPLLDDPTFDLTGLPFMHSRMTRLRNVDGPVHVARCGYTGEDGFEIAVPGESAVQVAELFLADSRVALAGLGARDSLRLEAGLCLYGHDLDATTTPVEAGLTWTIGKRRRQEGGFPGAEIILDQIKSGPPRRRVGLIVEGSPARENSIIFSEQGEEIGVVTSGIPSPSNPGQNIAMGYVRNGFHKTNTPLNVAVRKRHNPARVVKMPFVPAHYYKGV
ncbi:hypothetical protein IWQ60_002315 [Tieghemiomyces parasiticus]|uniref:Aminomethyltransferase n=1 Tax=Tieghemiomyces parasiticus TaxID=78921 RepID=A0A9W8DVT4_9FUNG|nr:hypothetical protein IWQ60_002315 [Tieghemiomyces parasiticus]